MTARTVIEFAVANTDIINSNHRLHHHARAKRTRELRQAAANAALAQGFIPLEHAHIYCHLSFGDNRRRDPGNWYPTAKACVDGFVDAGLLSDDDFTHLDGPDMRMGPRGERGVVGLAFEVIAA